MCAQKESNERFALNSTFLIVTTFVISIYKQVEFWIIFESQW